MASTPSTQAQDARQTATRQIRLLLSQLDEARRATVDPLEQRRLMQGVALLQAASELLDGEPAAREAQAQAASAPSDLPARGAHL